MLNLIIVHVKWYKNNSFFVLSNIYGKVLHTINLGTLGFKNMQKRNWNSFIVSIDMCCKQLLLLKKNIFYFKMEGFKNVYLKLFFKKLNLFLGNNKLRVLGLHWIQKTSHNGCRFLKR